MKKIALIAAALTTMASVPAAPAAAQDLKVQNMIGLCVRGNVTQGIQDPSCIAWYEGFSAAIRMTGRLAGVPSKDAACLPPGLTVDQEVLALLQYVQSDPANLSKDAAVGAYQSLARVYPCAR